MILERLRVYLSAGIFSLLIVVLSGCKQSSVKTDEFDLAKDRTVLMNENQLPSSGNVVLYLSTDESIKRYQRLDFEY